MVTHWIAAIQSVKRFAILLALIFLIGCDGPQSSDGTQGDPDSGAFVTLLGDDTLAVERFRIGPTQAEARVVLRSPRTTVREYRLDLNGDGTFARYEATVRDASTGSANSGADSPAASDATGRERRTVITAERDSFNVQIQQAGETETYRIAGDALALPFIDMVHWPFDLMLRRAAAAEQDTVQQPLFTERGLLTFAIGKKDAQRMTVTHPWRGTMHVTVDDEGRLLQLDAGATTRALLVTRVDEVDIDQIAARFAARDAAGASFGPLSGRGEASATVDGAAIHVDYGRPSKRGREIFGALVPWGEVWRTGANEATHLETSRPLNIAGLDVPAGRYTLFSIPKPDGATLIVNRQTNIGGTAYDAAHDLGRVEMRRSELNEPVEEFTILVEATGAGGEIKLLWDRTEYAVPFEVR